MPAAIDKAAYVAITKRSDTVIKLFASEFNEAVEFNLLSISKSTCSWANYILGIVDQFQKSGKEITGFNLLVDGDIPIGAGLSSSAAVECAVAFALNELFQLGFSKIEMALLAQKAEHEFAGVNCGVMDMFASLFGKKNHVIKLDCRSLDYSYEPLHLQDYKLLLINTNVKHQLSSSEYNVRRQQCEQGVAWVQQHVPSIKSLRDVTSKMLNEYILSKDALIYKRCKYVVDENNRLLEACNNLKKGDLVSLGKLMYATHDGLSKDYEVSCKELDYLVDFVKQDPTVIGSRMMGGGFGGCTINLIKEKDIEALMQQLTPAYFDKMGISLSYYIASIEDGTSVIK